MEKQHYVQLQREDKGASSTERIINVSDNDARELLASADILVTDYSSCFFDFVLRDKPVIHFMYDYDTYRDDDRGFYYDADYVRAGSIVKTKDELVSLIDDILGGTDSGSERRRIVRDRFDTYESASNSKIIVEEVLKRIHVV